ncbi:MAG: hypothetical protein ACRD9R_05565 [Pyrinomonadaceae bacterium]
MTEARDFAARLRERYWSVVAGLCLIAAAVLLWLWRLDAVFVVATLGALAWFLDVRNQLRPPHIERDVYADDDDDSESDSERAVDEQIVKR